MAVVGPPACCTSTMKFIFETYELYVCITDIRCVPIYVRYRFGNLHTARQHAIDQKTKALLTVAIFADPRKIYGPVMRSIPWLFHLQDPSLVKHDAQLVSSHHTSRSLNQAVATPWVHRRCRGAVIGRKQNRVALSAVTLRRE